MNNTQSAILAGKIGAGIFVIIMIIRSFGFVSTGDIGIRTRFGAVTGELVHPGIYLKMPLFSGVKIMDVQVQKEDADVDAASSNLQTVTSKISVNYQLSESSAVSVYSQIGQSYADQYIRPAIQETVKAVTAQYTAEELISKRPAVSEAMKTALAEKMKAIGIQVLAINITNFDFSSAFNHSVEAKAQAEQDALAAQNKLAQVKFEADQAVEEAKGKAQALQIESDAIKQNPDILKLKQIEKWNGVLPQVEGSATPFISLK